MSDCRPEWYRKYSETLQHWMDGEDQFHSKTDYRVYWKDNEGTEYRFATYATNSSDAIIKCAMAHPLIMKEVVKVHPFAHYDLLTAEQFVQTVDEILQKKYNFRNGAVENFRTLVNGHYIRGCTPDESAKGVDYEAEYGDEGT